ncbi:MAG: AAA family ATPase [Actinomycetota bacterium]
MKYDMQYRKLRYWKIDMYYKRELPGSIEMALRGMPVVLVTGKRQAGKSTMLLPDPRLSSRRYLNLDDYAVMRSIQANPDAVLSDLAEVTIDEAQRVRELLMAVKGAYTLACCVELG